MKKLTSIFLSLVMIIGLAACSQAPESHTSSENSTTLSNSTVQTDSEDTSGENSTDSISDTSNNDSDSNTSANGSTNSNSQNTNNGSNNSSSGSNASTNGNTSSNNQNTNNGGNNNSQSSSNTSSDKGGNITSKPVEESKPTEDTSPKILVAYFSATGTTEGVAETAADVMGADIYEIVPEVPYTSADLNYNDNNSRSTKEMNDPNARPAISGSVSDMAQYDIVFIGYPIWWGEAPRIVSTFMESYDFSGKTIVPFCTFGGSGVGSSARNLEKLTSGASFVAGQRLNGSASRSTVISWINGLNLNITAK